MAGNGHFLRAENLMDDVMIRDFPPNFKSYVKNNQLLCQRGNFNSGWVFWCGEDDPRERLPPPPPPFSEIIDGALIAPPIPEFMKIKSHFEEVVSFSWGAQFLIQFWKVIEIGGKRLLTTRHQLFGFNHINEGLCRYRLISLDYEFGVDGVSNEHLGLHGRVFRHQQLEFTPNVQYYSCKEYPQRDHAISCNIKHSLAVPLFEPSTRCCIGVIEMVSTTEITNTSLEIWSSYYCMLSWLVRGLPSSNCEHSYDRKDKDETLEEIRKMEYVVHSIHYLPLAQTWALCRLCNAVFIIYKNGVYNMRAFMEACDLQHLRKGQGVVGRAISSQNLVFCKDVTQFSITEYPLAHHAHKFGLTGSFAICLRSSYIEDNVYALEFFLPPNYCESGDPRIALVPLLTTMKQHCKSFKVASGEELGEELSIEVLDFSKDGKLYSYRIPNTARSPNRMENGEEMVFLDLSDQQLPEVDVIDTGNNVVTNIEETNIVVTSVQQNCIINLSQRLQRKAGIPISLEDLQQRFGMKLKDAAESLGVSRSTVKRACREYNITWWSPRKRSKDNQSLSNKLVQGVVQEQILESSQPSISDPPHMQDMATASRTKPHFTAAQDTSIVTIKAKYGDDFIKFQLPMSSGMLEFQQQVAKRLNLQCGTYRVKYQDEDNDWILIVCDDDLQNCICNSISQGRNTVTMLIQPITNCPS